MCPTHNSHLLKIIRLIDYWMEGGILRDYFDHKLTNKAHFDKLRKPELYTYGELQWDVNHCEETANIDIEYDVVCAPDVTEDCVPKLVISAERLMANETGRAENRKLAELLEITEGFGDSGYLANSTKYDCIWETIIGNNTDGSSPGEGIGYTDYRSREVVNPQHHMSTRHYKKMVMQLTRLINKYSSYDAETGIDWESNSNAQYLVELLTEHRIEIQADLDAKDPEENWPHPPKINWYVFPKCGEQAATGRRVWDYDYRDWIPGDDGWSGLVMK